jgi:signal peptidase I
VVQPVDAGDVKPGMVVVFVDPNDSARLVAHRIVKQYASDPPAYQTKGDANAAVDPFPVGVASIRGRVTWAIPGLGGLVIALRGAPAIVLLVLLPLVILLVTEVRDRRRPAAANTATA